MNHTETHDVHTTTLDKQFQDVKKITTQSPVCVYGDLTMGPGEKIFISVSFL